MATVWVTYAWVDNENGDVDFIASELKAAGLDVSLDRWNLKAGLRLWEQIEDFVCSKDRSDGWLLIATQNSLESEACKEEFAYALGRALEERGSGYPVLALFLGDVDDALIPAAISARLHISITDPDWKERITAAVERRDPDIGERDLEPYQLTVHGTHPSGRKVVEVRPRAGVWAPVFAGIPVNEKDHVNPLIMIEPAGAPSGTAMVVGAGAGESDDGKWWIMSIAQQATPTESLCLWCDDLPTEVLFGVNGGSPQFCVML